MAPSIPSLADEARPPEDAAKRALVEETAERVLAPTRSWAFVATLTACFGLTQVFLVRSGRFIHDEGLLTWLYASYLSRDPVATLFFLKAKPALAALNVPGAAFGLVGFYVGHAVIGCAGVVAVAAAARQAHVREWGIAALLYACSAMYVLGTAAGFSNVDAAALTAVALWLIFRSPKPGFGAALVIALLPWIRFEAGVFAVVSGLALLARDRNPRFLAGLFALPVAYLATGALWHHDALWFWHFPGAFAQFTGTGVHRAVEEDVQRTSIADVAFAVTTITPVVGLAVLPQRDGPRWVLVGQLCTVLFLVAIVVFPQVGVAMGYSQRYFLQILPVVALLVAHQMARLPRRLDVAMVATATACLTPLLLRTSAGARGSFSLMAMAGTLAFLTLAGRGRPRLAMVGLAAFVMAWPISGAPFDALQPRRHKVVAEAADWLQAHPFDGKSPTVITNLKLLHAYLALAKGGPPIDVCCLIQKDNEYELTELTNPANGQRARILDLAQWRFYGRGVLAREFAAHPAPPGALVVLQRDERLGGSLDADTLAAQGATLLLRSGDLSILRLP